MATQLQIARQGEISDAMRQVAADEGYAPEKIRDRVARESGERCSDCNWP